jgi:hypothetical protein
MAPIQKGLSFNWSNMLLACAACNRKKGDRFPVTESGDALLLDPSSDDPWDHLFFDTETGLVVARWRPEFAAPDAKGRVTASDEFIQLNVECVSEGRLRTKRNLERAVTTFLRNPSSPATEELAQALCDNDDYGLSFWFFNRDGREEEPFCLLREGHPDVWERLASLTRRQWSGDALDDIPA